jgi:hypothetical protein
LFCTSAGVIRTTVSATEIVECIAAHNTMGIISVFKF